MDIHGITPWNRGMIRSSRRTRRTKSTHHCHEGGGRRSSYQHKTKTTGMTMTTNMNKKGVGITLVHDWKARYEIGKGFY